MQEKKQGLGEDSDPILLTLNGLTVVGVLDGMGGAGGAECESDFGVHTKAYVASRIVQKSIIDFIRQNPDTVLQDGFEKQLEKVIKDRFDEEIMKYPPKSKAGLRSSLIKEYPTTLALLCISESKTGYIIDSFWAGDSRNYLWNSNGLFQISKDDLKGELDPLQNIREDAPMSNCINADSGFSINHKRIEGFSIGDRFIVLSATDGCFGYYPSPMDFEKILSDALKGAESKEVWEKRLSQAFAYVTGDDFSFSIAAFGYRDFKELKKIVGQSKKGYLSSYFHKRSAYEADIRKKIKLEEQIEQTNKQLEEDIDRIWCQYKEVYLKYFE